MNSFFTKGRNVTQHIRDGHFASNDPSILEPLVEAPLRDTFFYLWPQGTKLRGAENIDKAVSSFTVALERAAEQLRDITPFASLPSDACISQWKEQVLSRYRTAIKDPENFRIPEI